MSAALILIMQLLKAQSALQRELLREARERKIKASWRNHQESLRSAHEALPRLYIVSQFGSYTETLNLPPEILKPIKSFTDKLEEYVSDLHDNVRSRVRVSRFFTEETYANKSFSPKFYEHGSLGKQFHEGAKRRFHKECQDLSFLIANHYANLQLKEDDLFFLEQFHSFAQEVDDALQEFS